ncbi:MAG: hypothetical protein M0Z95_23770 [Actinomycetota bacterium]|nr:hypothetical protein [Actinomycetota bacterium]
MVLALMAVVMAAPVARKGAVPRARPTTVRRAPHHEPAPDPVMAKPSPVESLAASTAVAPGLPSPATGVSASSEPYRSTTTTTTSAPASPVSAPSTAAVPSPTTAVSAAAAGTGQSDPGNLVYPENVSATYQAPASNGVVASADWTGSPVLTLTISCPTAHTSRSGPSGLSVSLPEPAGAPGTCEVSVAETPSLPSTVSYLLTIGPTGG